MIEEATVTAYEKKKAAGHLNKLLRQLHELESQYHGQYMNDIWNAKAQLQALDADKYREALVRARLLRFSEEQPCRRSLGDDCRHALSKQVFQLEYNGMITANTGLIMTAFTYYYRNTFQAPKKSRE